MNLYIIIPALLMAVAAIAGIAYFACVAVARGRCILQLEECFDGMVAIADDVEAELKAAMAAAPQYGRDPKTGRFVKKSALEKLHQKKEREWTEETLRQRMVAVTAGVDVAGPHIGTTVVGWGRDGKPAWKE